MSSTEHVQSSLRAGVGEILLNRPDELNALSFPMIEALDRQLAAWAEDPKVASIALRGKGIQAFCAGLDQRALYQALRAGDLDYGRNFFRRYYQLLHRLANYPKPTLAVMDGATMGGGAALAMFCQKRVATRNTYFALTDCKMGFFPDSGAGMYLQRCPGETAMFLALTGLALRGRGLIHAGLATHLVPEDQVHLITPLLVDQLAILPPPSPMAEIEPTVNMVFGLAGPKEIMGILGIRSGEWAKGTLEILAKQSPTSLAVTYRHMRAARGMTLENVLKADYRLSLHMLAGHDFPEGIRAYVMERDEKPKWNPAELGEVTDAELDRLFGPVSGVADWMPTG